MSGERNIRWLKRDEDRLRKAVKNAKAKERREIQRLKELGSEGLGVRIIPSYSELRKSITTRKDFNKTVSDLTDFTKRYKVGLSAKDKKVLADFNAKIDRLAKADPKNKYNLPEKAKVGFIREHVKNKSDLREVIKTYKGFLSKGAEKLVEAPNNDYNLKITKWQRDVMLKNEAIVNAERAERRRQRENLSATLRGKEVGYKVGMGSVDDNNYAPVNAFTPKQDHFQVNKKFRTLMIEAQTGYWDERTEKLRNAFLRTIKDEFLIKHSDYKTENARVNDVIKAIQNMDIDEFYTIYEADVGKFENIYIDDKIAYEKWVSALESTYNPNRRA
jgi:hypothetical protein